MGREGGREEEEGEGNPSVILEKLLPDLHVHPAGQTEIEWRVVVSNFAMLQSGGKHRAKQICENTHDDHIDTQADADFFEVVRAQYKGVHGRH